MSIMNVISANQLKIQGISVVAAALQQATEAVISVRGEGKYVVMDFAQYEKFREYELEAALLEAKRDVKEGRYVSETAAQHVRRVSRGL